jgi:hypothetical protein
MIKIEKGLPKRQLRIKNKARFTLFIGILIITILAAFITAQKEQQIEYRPYVVSCGDTYWQLARKAQENGYNADIRVIIDSMVERSGIKAHELKEGDTILIPFVQE